MNLATSLTPTTYWYLTRATGAVALVLLTVSVVLGLVGTVRFTAPRWPRFAIDTLHRDVSLLVIVLLVLHVLTTVLDGFAPITLLDGIFPFLSPYRPFWLGLGTLSFDLILALVITSLVRRRLGYRAWRAVHWLAYVSWPIAVLHTLGTGTDVKQWWLLLLTVVCVVAVAVAVVIRISTVDRSRAALRGSAFALAAVIPLGIAIFALAGPLQHGWAKKAGTPASLLPHTFVSRTLGGSTASNTPPPGTHELKAPFSANLSGTVSQSSLQAGAIVELRMRVSGQVHGVLRMRLGGQPLPQGGLTMTGSQVDLAAVGTPSVYQGHVTALSGGHIVAHVTDSRGTSLQLAANVQINGQTSTVTGTLMGSPA
jgi:DMSO/TMAO reductase YedYZ heme-binding membrane subunit